MWKCNGTAVWGSPQRRVQPKPAKCVHCARKNHVSEKCRFENATCFRCRQRGHIATACSRAPEDGGGQRPVYLRVSLGSRRTSFFSTGSHGQQANWCDLVPCTSDPEWEAEDLGVDADDLGGDADRPGLRTVLLETGHQQMLVLGQPTGKPPLKATVSARTWQ